MEPIQSIRNTFSTDFISLNFSYLNNYFSKIDSLREDEDWKQILLLGEQALLDSKGSLSQKAAIHAQLASCSFYLGDYDLCLEHAHKCQLIAEYLDDPKHLMQSLYLLSAQKRAEASLCQNPLEQKELFREAKSYIYKALKHFDRCSDEHIKAKVLFNGGAAQADDPNGDLGVAVHWYREAMDIFAKLKEVDAYNRTAIRLAKLSLLLKKNDSCNRILSDIHFDSLTQKTKVHYYFVKAQYLVAIEDYPAASSLILDAIEMAAELQMKVDLDRLNDLLEKVKSQEKNLLSQLHLKC